MTAVALADGMGDAADVEASVSRSATPEAIERCMVLIELG